MCQFGNRFFFLGGCVFSFGRFGFFGVFARVRVCVCVYACARVYEGARMCAKFQTLCPFPRLHHHPTERKEKKQKTPCFTSIN